MNMLHQHLVLIVIGKNDNCRLDALVHISLSVRRREDYYAGVAFPWESVDTIVIVLVEHPEFESLNQLCLALTFLTAQHRQLNRRVIQNHV